MKRRLAIVAVAASSVCAAAALAHVPFVRAALGGASCPFGGAPDGARLEALRVKAAANLRGAGRAGARPAFGFELDVTKRDRVLSWGSAAGASCHEELGGAAIRCEGARVADGPRVADAFFRFDPAGRLVGVDVMREGASASDAAALFDALVATVSREAGAPSSLHRIDETKLAAPFARAAAEYRFADYAADVSTLRGGTDDASIVVREQYRSLSR